MIKKATEPSFGQEAGVSSPIIPETGIRWNISSPNKMIIGNDDLIYLEYPNAIEVKDITSLTDGVRNKRRRSATWYPAVFVFR